MQKIDVINSNYTQGRSIGFQLGCGREVVIYKILGGLLMSELNKYGIGFWAGGGIYSLVNLILNYKQVDQSEVLLYNYLILGVAIIGLILNIVLLKKRENKLEESRDKMVKHNPTVIVVLITIIEGLAIYLNMVAHPQHQPALTFFIVLVMAVIGGLYVRYDSSKC